MPIWGDAAGQRALILMAGLTSVSGSWSARRRRRGGVARSAMISEARSRYWSSVVGAATAQR